MIKSRINERKWFLVLGLMMIFVISFLWSAAVEAAPENLAYGKTVTVSSVESSEHLGNYAVDGNGNTRWSSSYADNQNFIVDLGTAQSVSGVKIAWEAAYATQYQIQVSNDNSTWTTVYEDYNATGGTETIDFTEVTARYVKLYCIRRATQYGFSVYEFEIYGGSSNSNSGTPSVGGDSNLAYQKTVTVSSVESSEHLGNYAVDGDGNTRWSSSYADNQNFIVDLGTAQNVSGVKIAWEAAYATQYQIQVSNDNSTWTTVYEDYSAAGGTETIDFADVTARYVKLYCIQRATQYGFSVYEFEVYGSAAGTESNPGTDSGTDSGSDSNVPSVEENSNLAYQKAVTVSSEESSEHLGSYAVDGNGNTRWSSTYADNQNFIVDLGSTQKVSAFKIAWEAAYATQYQIQVSNDNSTWTTVYENYNATGGTQTINISAVDARYVKVYCIQRATAYGFSIFEFEVYRNNLANGSGGNTGSGSTGSESADDFKLVGYLPNWYGDIINNVQLEKYTHVNYAFVIPDANGNIRPLTDTNFVNKLISTAHAKGVKVLVSVGGWSYNGEVLESTFVSATNTDAKCRTLANNIINLVEQYGFDGADIDWEYPRSNTRSQYEKFMRYLHEGLSQRGKLLTAAVVGCGSTADAYPDSVLQMMDWINVMAYDGNEGSGHSPYSYALQCGNYWRNTRGLAAEKVILGVPFYERPNWASYADIVNANSANAYKDSTTINGTVVYYNGLNTIAEKTKWACENAGGIMVWEMSQDSKNPQLSLLNKICETRDQMLK